ncbi:amino acid permease [Methanobacterium paludis]|uniref:Amino acid permease-associated region n=1 Tax=Methanobacterium paludis (strain DSM 25820 / JCM 18151 / SWAN1) TaxID=868131 RepID=F6D8B1_METPW|nr:amino acid permease [Methanobacterium paludis]AEG18545.1 amino acid permease-associated region [Methanobacterium paludis]
MTDSGLKRSLGLFDVVSLVVGTIVGADIYIAASFGAGFLGPSSIFAWITAGLMAIIIALCFAECSSIIPRVGGPYAYAREAFGDLTGFLVGWSLLIAEWSAIAVFPLAFVAYLRYFYQAMPFWEQIIIKVLFVLFLTFVNYRGVKEAGKINDILTVLKIAPIFILTLIGVVFFILQPSQLISNFTPISPLGFGGFGSALVLIFWAYVGFELVTVPSDEIINAKKTIPRAILMGMGIVTLFYVLTNFVILGVVPWKELATSSAPLALAGYAVMGSIGAILLALGALFSISGSDEAGILSSARIPYAMAGDGLLPHAFAKVHPKYGTPYVSLFVQNSITLVAAIFGTINQLIVLSVFTLLFCYLLTCVSVFPLRKKFEGGIRLPKIIPALGIVICIYMMTQCALNQIIIGAVFIALGIPIFWRYATGEEIKAVKRDMVLGRGLFSKWFMYPEKALAHFLRHLYNFLNRLRKRTVFMLFNFLS